MLFGYIVATAIIVLAAAIAMMIPRVYGVLCCCTAIFAFFYYGSLIEGILAALINLIIGLYNLYILSKKEKIYIFSQNIFYWMIVISVIFVLDFFFGFEAMFSL